VFQGFLFSLLLHGFFLSLFLVRLPFLNEKKEFSRTSGIVVIDLKSMKTTTETVLPPLRSRVSPPNPAQAQGTKTHEASANREKIKTEVPVQPTQKTTKTAKQTAVSSASTAKAQKSAPLPIRPAPKPKTTTVASSAVITDSALRPSEKKQPPKPVKPQRPTPSEPSESLYDMQSLLASVEDFKTSLQNKGAAIKDKKASVGNGQKTDKGTDSSASFGEEDSYSSAQTLAETTIGAYSLNATGLVAPEEIGISAKDKIGLMLRKCWNVDAGVQGIENMIIDIKVSLDRNGQIQDVFILNQERYQNDATFRSVSESARRAVYICGQNEEESPFKFLAQNYASSYSQWKELLLKFDPFIGGLL
jgi:outer membrane biosynthesis protein TonB